MVLEKEILSLSAWFIRSVPIALFVAILVTLLGLFVGYLIAVLRRGPVEAFFAVAAQVRDAIHDLLHLSWRRLGAMTWLAVQEALRRRILVAFAVFVVILLFAGWFLDRRAEDPAQLYLSFVLSTSNFLVLILAIFISTFSLPNDIKNRTVYTIVTKPVRIWEILLGRMFGFTIVGTLLLSVMGLFSYFFVVRGLDHSHRLHQVADDEPTGAAAASTEGKPISPPQPEQGAAGGENVVDANGLGGRRTTYDHFHRHTIIANEDGTYQTDMVMGHQHAMRVEGERVVMGPPQGMLRARVPVAGTLQFRDRSGAPAQAGINVGNEWGYRSYIEGGTLAAAIFRFEGITEARFPPDKFPNGLPLEMTIRVFRTYKGIVDQRIQGTITVVNPDPSVPEEQRARSTPFIFEPSEFYPKQEPIPWKLKIQRPDGTTDNADLIQDFVHDGQLEIWIQCEDRAQYFGVARNDAYLREADRTFAVNFLKGYLSIWCQMFIVICFGVMFSTVLSGPVAMMAATASLVMGYLSTFVADLSVGKVEGGGPIEALIRVLTQKNLTLDLELPVQYLEQAIKAVDMVFVFSMRAITAVLPNFENFATTDIIAQGFDIPWGFVAQHLIMASAFFVLVSATGYFLFKSREIAA